MSAVELAVEKVKKLDEHQLRELLEWLNRKEAERAKSRKPRGAVAMLGFARKYHSQPRTTEEWMMELREGERD